jgi:hypothetical membrane protein
MSPRAGLLFGPLAGVMFALGVALLGHLVPGYDPVVQTVSEIGEIGSPARIPFTAMLFCVAGCIVVFASALCRLSLRLGRPATSGYVAGVMALSAAGIGVFAYPHPLHNLFGMSELFGYQAPLVLALTWRGEKRAKALLAFTWIMAVLVWAAIAANLGALDRDGILWHREAAVYGVIQRSLFAAWFVWLAGAGLLLRRLPVRAASEHEAEALAARHS